MSAGPSRHVGRRALPRRSSSGSALADPLRQHNFCSSISTSPSSTFPALPSLSLPPPPPQVWRPGVDQLAEGEELDYDRTAYHCLHRWTSEWPCLTLDVVRDGLGGPRSAFPHALTCVAGTQAGRGGTPEILVMATSDLGRQGHGPRAPRAGEESDESSSESSTDEDEEGEAGEDGAGAAGGAAGARPGREAPPRLQARRVESGAGNVNRLRLCPQQQRLCASWGDAGRVSVHDLSAALAAVAVPAAEWRDPPGRDRSPPVQTFGGHGVEGWAVDWSPVREGRLATGDQRGRIHVWEPSGGGRWSVGEARPLTGHAASVEDLQWSPTEDTVLASCGVDGTIRVWDTRDGGGGGGGAAGAGPGPRLTLPRAHGRGVDVNVLGWNALAGHMLASGGDDGGLRVWDLRTLASSADALGPAGAAGLGGGADGPPVPPVAVFAWHAAPVASVQWCPYESSTLVTAGADGQILCWDVALEADPEEEAALGPEVGGRDNAAAPADAPAQLLFAHLGQADPKDARWHPQIPGMIVSTGADGFDAFLPANL